MSAFLKRVRFVLRRLFIFILLAAGLGLIVFGVQRWLDHRAATSVATAFIEALRDGDREAALSLLSPEQREAVERKTGDKDSPFWSANPGMTYRIHHAELDGDTGPDLSRASRDCVVWKLLGRRWKL